MSALAEAVNWGRWGDDDERGALNLVDDDSVLAATRLCRTGRLYQLALPIQRAGIPNFEYRGIPQRLTLTSYNDVELYGSYGAPSDVGGNEDMLVFASHTTTHIDALCHVHEGGAIYNGFPRENMSTYGGATRCGIENAGAFAARGVLLDVAASKGVACLEPGYVITAADLQDALALQDVTLRPGDVVLLRTGWVEQFLEAGEGEVDMFAQPGIGLDAARWLGAQDPIAVGADNSAVEVSPWDDGAFLGVHRELLVKRGVHLVEHLQLARLARDRCYEFFFCAAPLLITGATASPLNPIAIG
jgi:kynurenine formamidase